MNYMEAINYMSPKRPSKDTYEFKSRSEYPKYLFHRTKEDSIRSILLSNKLIASSRSKWEDNRVSMSIGINGKEFGPITLVIDADRLREDYLVKEFDYDKSMGQYAYEKEWYTDIDICNLNKYLVDIISDYDDCYDKLYLYQKINEAIEKIVKLPSAEVIDTFGTI